MDLHVASDRIIKSKIRRRDLRVLFVGTNLVEYGSAKVNESRTINGFAAVIEF